MVNELGNPILPCSAEVIIIQFRKFIAILAYNLMFLKRQSEDPSHFNPDITWDLDWYWWDGNFYFNSIYHPSPIIDSVWRMLILDSKIYKEFWYELCGHFIDRVDPFWSRFVYNKIYSWENHMYSIDNWFK